MTKFTCNNCGIPVEARRSYIIPIYHANRGPSEAQLLLCPWCDNVMFKGLDGVFLPLDAVQRPFRFLKPPVPPPETEAGPPEL